MHENPVQALLFRQLEQSIKMRLLRVNPAIGDKPEDVQTTSTGSCVFYGRNQRRIGEEVTILNHQLDASDVHVHDAPCADVEVPNLAVAHLTLGKSNKWAASVNERVWVLAKKPVIGRFAGKCDGVGFSLRAEAPSVEDDENKRFGTGHGSFLLLRISYLE